jgi:hypothetical protein
MSSRPACLAELESHFAHVTGPAVVQASADHMRALLAYVAELELRLGVRGALQPLTQERWVVVRERAGETWR